jgi:tRNA pseudouridine55 synthase
MEAKPRIVEIFAAELLELGDERLRCRVACSSGTYIRTLAETIAERLGTVGHVDRLVRVAVGSWTIEHAKDLDWLAGASDEALALAVDSRQPSLTDDDRSAALIASRACPS